MPDLRLSGPQRRRFSEVLGSAFTRQRLRELLDYRLDRRLDDISLGEDYQQIRFELIRAAEAQGWTAELLLAAREENPGNDDLFAFAQAMNVVAVTLVQERQIREHSPYFDLVKLRRRLGEIEGRVCRIEIPVPGGTASGSGFLVGPDAVMTNYHVIEPVLHGEATPSDLVLRFDYKLLEGSVINGGTTFGLAEDGWLIDSSPLSQVDLEPDPKSALPSASELDYAVLRIDHSVGDEPIGKGSEISPTRGWIEIGPVAHPVGPGSPLFVVQHPQAQPLKLALEMDGVIALFADGTRMRHRVNTESGSSGSPCFNSDFELVGVHHVGDPNFAGPAEFNEAIAIDAIVALMQQPGHVAEVLVGRA